MEFATLSDLAAVPAALVLGALSTYYLRDESARVRRVVGLWVVFTVLAVVTTPSVVVTRRVEEQTGPMAERISALEEHFRDTREHCNRVSAQMDAVRRGFGAEAPPAITSGCVRLTSSGAVERVPCAD